MKPIAKYAVAIGAIVLIGATVTTVASGETDNVAIPDGYTRMVFSDEFNTPGLPDSTKWAFEIGYVRNGEMQFYTEGTNARCEGGVLVIEARNDSATIDGSVCPVTSASLNTRQAWRYGYIEVRAKIPSFRGSWPAIWMMPQHSVYGAWPRSGEIDIMEQVGFDPDVVHFTAHTSKYNGGAPANKHHYSVRVPTNYTEFHVYSLVWTPDKLQWLVDDKVRYTFKKNSPNWLDWPFDRDFYIILNLAWGGGWGGQQGIDEAALPAHYEVDYVRVFQ